MAEDRDQQNSPLKFLAIAASPMLLVITGVVVFAGSWIPHYMLLTMAVLAFAAIAALTLVVILTDGMRRKHFFSKEYFWFAALLAAFMVSNLVLMFI